MMRSLVFEERFQNYWFTEWQLTSLLKCSCVIKSIISPKLIYTMQMLPLIIANKDIKSLNKYFTKFIWNIKKHCIHIDKMYLSKQYGGVSLPNIKLFNKIDVFHYAGEWILQYIRTVLQI
ncbi:hypothetical protein FKM82_001049 [Ascaphus truei]